MAISRSGALLTSICVVSFFLAATGTPTAAGSTAADPLPRVPPGFAISAYAVLGGTGTSLAFGAGPGGTEHLYVTDHAGGRVIAFEHLGVAPGPARNFATGLSSPLGVVVDENGTVFVSDSQVGPGPFGNRPYGRVSRLPDADGDGQADERNTVVEHLPNGRHNTNGLAFGPDGKLYIANGNSTDDGVEGGDPEVVPWSGSVIRVDPRATDVSLASLPTRKTLVATGMRNVYDLAFSPVRNGELFLPTNGVDDAREGSTGSTVPTEELENSDDLLYRTKVTDKRADDFGFPACLYHEERQGDLEPYDNPNPAVREAFGSCPRSVPRPVSSFGTHVSADGAAFQTSDAWGKDFRNDLFVAEFGNLFGVEPKGHRVVRVEFDRSGRKVVRQSEFVSSVTALDVAFDSDGALYVLSFSGTIYRIAKVADVPGTVDVSINAYQYIAQDLVIPEGTVVRWTNDDVLGLTHNVISQGAVTPEGAGPGSAINSPDLAVGKTHEFRFDEPGKWVYTCTIGTVHTALMHGSITVVPAGN